MPFSILSTKNHSKSIKLHLNPLKNGKKRQPLTNSCYNALRDMKQLQFHLKPDN